MVYTWKIRFWIYRLFRMEKIFLENIVDCMLERGGGCFRDAQEFAEFHHYLARISENYLSALRSMARLKASETGPGYTLGDSLIRAWQTFKSCILTSFYTMALPFTNDKSYFADFYRQVWASIGAGTANLDAARRRVASQMLEYLSRYIRILCNTCQGRGTCDIDRINSEIDEIESCIIRETETAERLPRCGV